MAGSEVTCDTVRHVVAPVGSGSAALRPLAPAVLLRALSGPNVTREGSRALSALGAASEPAIPSRLC
eukprot:8654045-Alexandrium_andersonii.AAC.1